MVKIVKAKEAIQKPVRQSGIELLRIFATCGVVLLHYNNPLIGISGYFLCKSNTRTLSKPLSLVLMVVAINIMLYCYALFAGNVSFSLYDVLQVVIPHNYFVTLYVTLYFISPFINRALKDIDKSQWRVMLVIGLAFFSFWPTMADVLVEATHHEWFGISTIGAWGSQSGYNIVNFVLLYVLGAYIRLMGIEKRPFKTSKLFIYVGLCLILSFCWAWFSSHDSNSIGSSAWTYHNPLTIMMAVLLFLLFSRIRITSIIINDVAKAAFACFLIHGHVITHMNIKEFVQRPIPIMLIHIIACIIASYLISFIFYKVYDLTIDRLVRKNIKQTIVL